MMTFALAILGGALVRHGMVNSDITALIAGAGFIVLAVGGLFR